MNIAEKSYVVVCGGFALWCIYALYMLVTEPAQACISVQRHERNLSPHEQQPEPIPAVMQGEFDVERLIL